MTAKIFLVDFENVPSVDLSEIGEECRVIVFTGASQKSVPLDLVAAVEKFGGRLEWRRVDANGKNALDFFIACELGRVQALADDTACTVLSNDKGFDPLLRHLNSVGVKCQRVGTLLATKPAAGSASRAATDPSQYARVLEVLGKSEKKTRPRKMKTLGQFISSLFQKKINKDVVKKIIADMLAAKKISDNSGNITYNF
jgi:hypothetical protein